MTEPESFTMKVTEVHDIQGRFLVFTGEVTGHEQRIGPCTATLLVGERPVASAALAFGF